MFSKHVDSKLNLDPDLYHSMNMLSQKHTIMNKLRKSLVNPNSSKKHNKSLLANNSKVKSIISPVQNTTIDNAELNTMDNTSNNSDVNGTTLMYGRCSKHENWKDFQIKRCVKNYKSRFGVSKSTLPVLKFQKEQLSKYTNRASVGPRKSRDRIKQL